MSAVLFTVLDSGFGQCGEIEGARLRRMGKGRKEGSWGKDMQGPQGYDRSTAGTHLAIRQRCNSHQLLDKESAIGRLLKSAGTKDCSDYVTFCQGSPPSGFGEHGNGSRRTINVSVTVLTNTMPQWHRSHRTNPKHHDGARYSRQPRRPSLVSNPDWTRS
jgi:hypothetical protein